MGWKQVYDETVPNRKVNEVLVGDEWIIDNIENAHGQPLPQGEHTDDPYSLFPEGLLTEEEKEVLDMVVIAGHSERKTATFLGISPRTVGRRQRVALNKMREYLEQNNG